MSKEGIVYRSLPQKTHSKMQSFLERTLHQVGHPLGYKILSPDDAALELRVKLAEYLRFGLRKGCSLLRKESEALVVMRDRPVRRSACPSLSR